FLQARAVELTQWDRGEFHLKPGPGAQESIDEYLAGMAKIHLVELFVKGRDQHGGPEQVDRASTLPMPAQPVGERFARPLVGAERQAGQAVADPQLISPVQVTGAQETLGQVERSGTQSGPEPRDPSLGTKKHDGRLTAKEVADTPPLAEIAQVCAAGHADMLTVVHQLAGDGVSERAGTAAQPGPAFQE